MRAQRLGSCGGWSDWYGWCGPTELEYVGLQFDPRLRGVLVAHLSKLDHVLVHLGRH
jgi:hypothetical protein